MPKCSIAVCPLTALAARCTARFVFAFCPPPFASGLSHGPRQLLRLDDDRKQHFRHRRRRHEPLQRRRQVMNKSKNVENTCLMYCTHKQEPDVVSSARVLRHDYGSDRVLHNMIHFFKRVPCSRGCLLRLAKGVNQHNEVPTTVAPGA